MLKFFESVIDLKKVHRQGWIDQLGLNNPESVTDHSFSMTIMAMVLSDIQKLDTEKVIRISLLHDLAESKTGDVTPKMMSRDEKKEIERKAMKKIFDFLPKEISNCYQKLWDEYQDNSSEESQFVHDIDKLEMAFQAYCYSKDGFSKKELKTFFDTANNEIKNENVRKILSKLLQMV